MNEVEKMYKNAGISCKPNYVYNKVPILSGLKYPPFTAEKQLELIKWLIQRYKEIVIEHKLNLYYINIRDIYTGMVHIEIDETIAGLINYLWQDLTDAEKAQIKNILESEVRE